MEFIVHLQVTWPPENDPEHLARLVKEEHERAVELAAAGFIKRLWRVPADAPTGGCGKQPMPRSCTQL